MIDSCDLYVFRIFIGKF